MVTHDEPVTPDPIDPKTGDRIIERDEAIALLGSEPVGRVGFVADGRPHVLPVNHRWHDGAIVFRTLAGLKLHAAADGSEVCFEVDRWDPTTRTGWSVVATGTASEVTNFAEREVLENIGLVPWSDAVWRPVWVRIDPHQVTGRDLGGGFG